MESVHKVDDAGRNLKIFVKKFKQNSPQNATIKLASHYLEEKFNDILCYIGQPSILRRDILENNLKQQKSEKIRILY